MRELGKQQITIGFRRSDSSLKSSNRLCEKKNEKKKLDFHNIFSFSQ